MKTWANAVKRTRVEAKVLSEASLVSVVDSVDVSVVGSVVVAGVVSGVSVVSVVSISPLHLSVSQKHCSYFSSVCKWNNFL